MWSDEKQKWYQTPTSFWGFEYRGLWFAFQSILTFPQAFFLEGSLSNGHHGLIPLLTIGIFIVQMSSWDEMDYKGQLIIVHFYLRILSILGQLNVILLSPVIIIPLILP